MQVRLSFDTNDSFQHHNSLVNPLIAEVHSDDVMTVWYGSAYWVAVRHNDQIILAKCHETRTVIDKGDKTWVISAVAGSDTFAQMVHYGYERITFTVLQYQVLTTEQFYQWQREQ